MSKQNKKNVSNMIKAEVLPWGEGAKVLRVGIPVTDEFLEVLTELCKIREEDFRRYIEKAIHNGVELDLDTPQDIGIDVCKRLNNIINPQSSNRGG